MTPDGDAEWLDTRAEVVTTAFPAVSILACRLCGVLLWDVGKHYDHAHGEAAP